MPALIRAALAAVLAAAAGGPAYPDEAAVLHEVNWLRAHPADYAGELGRIATGYRGAYYREAESTEHASVEGAPAVLAAASALAGQPPLPPLAPDPVLRAAARDLVEAQGPTGAIGHRGPAGDGPGERVKRHGGDIYVSEVIAYGMHDAADVVRELVVDDGRADRGHRRVLLTGFYRYAGAWCGPHATQGTMCVVDLSAEPGGRPHVPVG